MNDDFHFHIYNFICLKKTDHIVDLKMASEKFCLKWNDFQNNITSSFANLKSDTDFSDVTLVCEDGQQLEAHKAILATSSPFFNKLLKKNKHPHPLIIMRGVNYDDLSAIIDFLYVGEANVYQENLENFLSFAEDLQLKRLTENTSPDKSKVPLGVQSTVTAPRQSKPAATTVKCEEVLIDDNNTKHFGESDKTIALPASYNARGDFQELDEQIKSMMGQSQNTLPNGRKKKVCKVCEKEGDYRVIKDHIEARHIEGVSIPCNSCDKIFRCRAFLQTHIQRNHNV